MHQHVAIRIVGHGREHDKGRNALGEIDLCRSKLRRIVWHVLDDIDQDFSGLAALVSLEHERHVLIGDLLQRAIRRELLAVMHHQVRV